MTTTPFSPLPPSPPVPRHRPIVLTLVAVCGVTGLLGGCGSSSDDAGDPDPELSTLAAEGRDIARDNGCASCHGTDGDGGVGPAWVGLAGSEVELEDGSTTTADAAYLDRAIADPTADVVSGYTIQMPENSLTADERTAVVAYIEELG